MFLSEIIINEWNDVVPAAYLHINYYNICIYVIEQIDSDVMDGYCSL